MNDRFSFERLGQWVAEVERTSRFAQVLVGNNVRPDDGHDGGAVEREVTVEEAEAFAAKHGMGYTEVDMGSGLGVEDVFQAILTTVVKHIPDPAEPSMLLRSGIKIGNKLLNDRRYKRSLYAASEVR